MLIGNLDEENELYGGRGNDLLIGGNLNDYLGGGRGNDNLWGGNGDDELWGDQGDDTLDGQNGDDMLNGGDGRDVLFGGAGDDKLYGKNDDDFLDGGDGNDILFGGDVGYDADDFVAGKGNDYIYGGNGRDSLYFAGNADDYFLDITTKYPGSSDETFTFTDSVAGRDGVDKVVSVEDFFFKDQWIDSDDIPREGFITITAEQLKEAVASFGASHASLSDVKDYLKSQGEWTLSLTAPSSLVK
ncbi:MAG: hypothetical protein K1X44_02745 [Alphaproteobacteria bacterium]|nr:hypothetical protein [Alphaproteobacteria bacterium]